MSKLPFLSKLVFSLSSKKYQSIRHFLSHFNRVFFTYRRSPSTAMLSALAQVKIWFQNRRSKVKKMMKQHQHGGPVTNNGTAGANGQGGTGPPGSGTGSVGPTASGESHVHSAGGLPPRDCWNHQPSSSHPHHQHRRLAPDDDPSPPRRDVIDDDDDDDDESTKKPLHLLQLQTAMHRFSPPEIGHHGRAGGGGLQIKASAIPSSYRGSPTPLHPVPASVRYHHGQHGTPMPSPIHAWPDAGVDMLPPGLQQSHSQQQRLHPAGGSNQPSSYQNSAYMMTSSDMTSSYQSWYPGAAQQLQQPPHHLSTMLS